MGSRIIMYDVGDIVLPSYGKLWAQLRKICTIDLLTAKRVKHFKTLMQKQGDSLIEKIRMANGSPVNMTEMLLSVANNTISQASFGMERHLEKVCNVLDSTLNDIIAEHEDKYARKHDDVDEDLVDVLLRLKRTGDLDASVKMENLKGVLVVNDLILGRTKTTSAIMEWMMAEMIIHPEVMRKAQSGVQSAFKGKTKIHEDDIANLPYLNMNDAESVKPERVQTDEQDFNPTRFQYMPYGGGSGIFPGINFGMTSIEVVLANLLYHFDWELPGGRLLEEMDMEESMGLALTRKNPLFLNGFYEDREQLFDHDPVDAAGLEMIECAQKFMSACIVKMKKFAPSHITSRRLETGGTSTSSQEIAASSSLLSEQSLQVSSEGKNELGKAQVATHRRMHHSKQVQEKRR
ncbi:Cytochrome P450 71D8 [Platanthera zijinensis]|uniref:Cytochrome P450 71D8 n=1 Tax=Platanthera zijinensis TaxID=2320716 RepID=A0AAP0BJM8_9ASPA